MKKYLSWTKPAKQIVPACLGLMLCACSTSSDFKRPLPPETTRYTHIDEDIEESFNLPLSTGSPESLVSLSSQLSSVPMQKLDGFGDKEENQKGEWWKVFQCDKLNILIQQVMTDNYTITMFQEALLQAEVAIKANQSDLWPEINVGASTGRQQYGAALFGPSNFFIPPFTYYEVGPSLTWLLDIFGGTRHSIERKQALAEYQAHELRAASLTLIGQVVQSALEMASLKAEIAAIERMIREDEKTLRLIEISYQAGSGTKIDLLTAENQLDNDKGRLPPLKQQWSVLRHALAILAGKSPADWVAPSFELEDFQFPSSIPLSLPSELIRKRPDIRAAEAQLHAASAAVGIARAQLYPKITISANGMQQALAPSGLLEAANKTWFIGADLTAPLFNAGKLRAGKRQAEHAYQEALAHYQQTILLAFGQVADLLTALAQDNESVALRERTMGRAETSLALAESSYQAGASGLLEIQNTTRLLAEADFQHTHAQKQQYLDMVQLFVALGN